MTAVYTGEHDSGRALFRLGLDIDGVFADFNTRFAALLHLMDARLPKIPLPTTFPMYDWMPHYGYTGAEIQAAYTHLHGDTGWWSSLDAFPGTDAFMSTISTMVSSRLLEVVFLTTRHSRTSHAQTVYWLEQHKMRTPQVCICRTASSKADVARGLGLHVYVDDYVHNIGRMIEEAPDTRVVLYRSDATMNGLRSRDYAIDTGRLEDLLALLMTLWEAH